MALFFLFCFGVLLYIGIKKQKPLFKKIFFSLSSVLFALFLFEIYGQFVTSDENAVFSGTFADNKLVSGKKDLLGFGPAEDTCFKVTAIRKQNDSLIYNVVYSFKNGQRIVPENNDSAINQAVFLGCSYVFGDGLNDNQTLPYFFSQFSSATEKQFDVQNYAFSGYGAHQAYMITTEKLLKNKQKPLQEGSIVIYYFIPSHIERAAGSVIWDVFGPWYEVENGQIVLKGTFDDKNLFRENYVTKRLTSIWQNSNLYKSFFQPKTTQKDVQRVMEMIKQMNFEFSRKKIRFIVVVGSFNSTDENHDMIKSTLYSNNIEHYFIDSIIPSFQKKKASYTIIGDGHPNEKFNIELARYLVDISKNQRVF